MMASWQGSSNPVPILEKIYRDLHDIKLHLMPSYAEREGANEAFPAAAAAGAGAAAVRALKMLAGAAAAGAEAEWIHKIISGKRFLWNPSNNHLYLYTINFGKLPQHSGHDHSRFSNGYGSQL